MKKEIERLQKEYQDILQGKEIMLEMEKSDPLDNRSARCYRLWVVITLDNIICEYGFCKNKEFILERFEYDIKGQLKDIEYKKQELEGNLETLEFVRKELGLNEK